MNHFIPSLAAILALSLTARAAPLGSAFTWQGRLNQNGAPASGSFDLRFELYNVEAGGAPVVAAVERLAQPISNGLFSTELDFGGPAVFDGTAYWLAIYARVAGAPDYIPVPGRTAIRPAPYALHALSAGAVKDGAITNNSLANGAVTSAKLSAGAVGFAQLSAPAVPNPGQLLAFDGNALSWINPAGGSGPWLLNGTTAFYNAGTVSIGTNTPPAGYKLAVNGGVQFTAGGLGGTLQFGAPGGETGMTIAGTARADYRFDGTLLKLLAGPAGGPPSNANGIVIDTTGNIGMGLLAPTAGYRLAVNGAVQIASGSGGTLQVGSPNGETGSSILRGGNRADLRFDGLSLKLVATAGVGPPGPLNGLAVATSGNVGIGTVSPAHKLEVIGNIKATSIVLGNNPGTADAPIYSDSTASTRVVLFNYARNGLMDMVCQKGDVSTLTIRGGADLAEPFAMSHSGVEPGSVVVIDEENPGKLKASTRAYDKKVAGIVSGANGIKPGISMIQEDKLEAGENVALSGRVYVKADTSAGAIEPGDLLTTSSTAGRAMKAADHDKAQGAIIGKAMTPLKDADGMVLVLVSLQ